MILDQDLVPFCGWLVRIHGRANMKPHTCVGKGFDPKGLKGFGAGGQENRHALRNVRDLDGTEL